jgi:hypothetical protein
MYGMYGMHYQHDQRTGIQRPVFANRRAAAREVDHGVACVSPSEFWLVGAVIWWTGAAALPLQQGCRP